MRPANPYGNFLSTWGALRTTRDPDDLQGYSDATARSMGFAPDTLPRVIFDNSGDPRELGYSVPQTRMQDSRGAPFIGQKSPGGFIALSPAGDPRETIRHELNHLRAGQLAPLRPDPYRSSKSNPAFLDTTHGMGENAGAAFYGGDISKNPYYDWFLDEKPWTSESAWSRMRKRR